MLFFSSAFLQNRWFLTTVFFLNIWMFIEYSYRPALYLVYQYFVCFPLFVFLAFNSSYLCLPMMRMVIVSLHCFMFCLQLPTCIWIVRGWVSEFYHGFILFTAPCLCWFLPGRHAVSDGSSWVPRTSWKVSRTCIISCDTVTKHFF